MSQDNLRDRSDPADADSGPRGSRRKRKPEPAINSVEATRRAHKKPSYSAAAAAAAPNSTSERAAAPAVAPDRPSGDSDPWTVPESVRDRFVQDGHRFYFPDGAPAFRDQGRKLTTASENTQVVHSLVDIAQSRGWSEVTVAGSERFRQEAWRQARIAGINVRGYRPTDTEQAQLIRALARGRSAPASQRGDSISPDGPPPEPRVPVAAAPVARTAGATRHERVAGKLLDHGQDAYRHDPKEEASYFVHVETAEGRREIWGRDLERAVSHSLSQPKIGDDVILQKTGSDVVTVQRAERDSDGQLRPKQIEAHRNRWMIEKSDFLRDRAEAAGVVRDATTDPRTAVREHPELAGTYLALKAAELAAKRLRDGEDQRRFVGQVRSALANDIERGEPLQVVRLRERRAVRASQEQDRDPVR